MSLTLSKKLKFLDNFLEMLDIERGASKNTVDSYCRDLRHFSEVNGKELNQANTEDIRYYLSYLNKEGMAPSSAA